MGNCSSNLSLATAKLIVNGQLEEFLYPVAVSQILKRNPSCFICKADEMKYDDYILAIDGEEELQLDQLYFSLPTSWLSSQLKPQQMAALAVKASLALKKAGGGQRTNWRGIKRIQPLVYTSPEAMEYRSTVLGGGSSCGSRGLVVNNRKGKSSGDRRRSQFIPNLNAIIEE